MREDRQTAIYSMWEDAESYKNKLGIVAQIPQNRDFYENRQWGNIKKGTERLPRPQYPLIEQIVDAKVSNITSSVVASHFFSKDDENAGTMITKFDEHISEEIGEDAKRKNIVNSGATDGNGIIHYFWNSNKRNQRGEYKGGLDAEEIDILDFGVANPKEEDIQKQEWIIIREQVSVAEAKAECENKAYKGNIVADDQSEATAYKSGITTDSNNLVWVYTRFFRINNEVYYEKSTKNVTLVSPTPCNPIITYNEKFKLKENSDDNESDEDYSNLSNIDKLNKSKIEITRCFNKYPFSNYVYKRRRGSFYGRSEVEHLINNNIAINYNTAMMCLSAENQGWGTIVAREGALGVNSSLTNDPSKMLIDKYKGGANGFYPLNKQPFSQQVIQLNNDMMEKTKNFSGANDVITGEPNYDGQSGYAIAYLQQQAQKPIDKMVDNYHDFIKCCNEIKLQFYLLYYDNENFSIKKEDSEEIEDTVFNGNDYINMDFNITVKVGAGTKFSELGGINMLDNLFASQRMDAIDYIKAYPDNILPNKSQILEILKNQEQKEINQLKGQIASLTTNFNKAVQLLQAQNNKVKSIERTASDNDNLRNRLANTSAELSTTRNDATMMAQSIANKNQGN